MKLREQPDAVRQKQDPPADPPGDNHLEQLRQDGEEFLRAGEDAINRALSGNSEAFLAAIRQQGGE